MKKRIDITTNYYFPTPMIFLGIIFLIASGGLLFQYQIISLLLILASLVIFTARYRLSINLMQKTYRDHLWIAGFKKGSLVPFDSIEGLFINQNAYAQRLNSYASSITWHGTEYNGYIRIDGEDIHLLSHDKKDKVLKKMEKIQQVLRGDIITSNEIKINPDIQDLTKEE